jgi:hypothetical protein
MKSRNANRIQRAHTPLDGCRNIFPSCAEGLDRQRENCHVGDSRLKPNAGVLHPSKEVEQLNRTRNLSARLLHLVTALDEQRGMISFCCESHPLVTVRTYGPPARCPFCHQPSPLGGGEARVQNLHPKVRGSSRTEKQ